MAVDNIITRCTAPPNLLEPAYDLGISQGFPLSLTAQSYHMQTWEMLSNERDATRKGGRFKGSVAGHQHFVTPPYKICLFLKEQMDHFSIHESILYVCVCLCLSICLSVCIYVSVCLYLCVSVYVCCQCICDIYMHYSYVNILYAWYFMYVWCVWMHVFCVSVRWACVRCIFVYPCGIYSWVCFVRWMYIYECVLYMRWACMCLSMFTMSCMWHSVCRRVQWVSILSYVCCVVLGKIGRRDE